MVISPDGTTRLEPAPTFKPLPQPLPPVQPVWQNKLSLDQMIGIFVGLVVLSMLHFDPHLMLIIGGIWVIIYAWKRLKRVAPVTADVILCIFGILLLALLSLGGGRGWRGRRRRW